LGIYGISILRTFFNLKQIFSPVINGNQSQARRVVKKIPYSRFGMDLKKFDIIYLNTTIPFSAGVFTGETRCLLN